MVDPQDDRFIDPMDPSEDGCIDGHPDDCMCILHMLRATREGRLF